MCSRLDAERDVVMRRFELDTASDLWDSAKWGELFPTDPLAVLGPARTPAVLRWGLTPDWAERPLINAKAEDAAHKRTFQPLLEQRCVVPVTGYYEWRVEDGRKVKTRIFDGTVLPMAGLVDGGAVVIFTCAPSPGIAHIHNRMPAILDDDRLDEWLDPKAAFKDVRGLLSPSARNLEFADAAPSAAKRSERTPQPPRQASLF